MTAPAPPQVDASAGPIKIHIPKQDAVKLKVNPKTLTFRSLTKKADCEIFPLDT